MYTLLGKPDKAKLAASLTTASPVVDSLCSSNIRTLPIMATVESSEKSWRVDVEEMSWVAAIDERVKLVDPSAEEEHWKRPSTYKVPPFVRELKKEILWCPQVVSFGPYHYGKGHLKPLEVHKERALLHFLRRAGKPLVWFLEAIRSEVDRLQDFYDGLGEEWRRDEGRFARLMVVDGAFMLEALRLEAKEGGAAAAGYAPNDPFFSHHALLHKMPYVRRDMLMIENQLPFLVLKKLLAVQKGDSDEDLDARINRLVLNFCGIDTPKEETWTKAPALHAIDLFRRSKLNPKPCSPPTAARLRGPRHPYHAVGTLRSAVELHEAGIRFHRSGSAVLTDLRFESGVLTLPPIMIDDATECELVNLIAWEHQHVDASDEVSSYVALMDALIDSDKDVVILEDARVIENSLGSNKDLADLFNRLASDVTLDREGSLWRVQSDVDRYCRRHWPRWRATLNHNYLTNPWALISVIAATFVIGLSILQTVYAILTYYNRS